ncbi:ciliary microtubule associated protein 1A-like [Asterias amurensis]|uniref:ciliary microtubule associated protein 1A-like n=1 Tax=Asterias amurensis TaxID=7602 RepID=UPI003AB8D349
MAWEPTLPRQPIAAMYNGPGPGQYLLPGGTGTMRSDPRKKQLPAYSFGTRHREYTDDCSPGPRYLIDSRLTRTGKSGDPHYSVYSRPRDVRVFSTPGPGRYSPEKAGQNAYRKAASYSFGARTKGSKHDKSPAPNNYSLPSILGGKSSAVNSAPNYSMTGRSKIGAVDEDLSKTPGPGTYRVVEPSIYKKRDPLYSMTGRNTMPSDSTQKPGPGGHCPEKVIINKPQAPKFSFGVRHSEYTTPMISEPSD